MCDHICAQVQAEFLHLVKQGFQASATLMQGSITADETRVTGTTAVHWSWPA